jgi:hypothetical protein
LEKNDAFSTLKIMICRKYSSQKQTQFSLEENALQAPTSKTDAFLERNLRSLNIVE